MNSTGKVVNLVNPSNNQDAATKSYVDTSIPIGGIIMWSGAGVTLPSNWKLCDGTSYNGITTPDLRGRFVLSSGSGSGLTARTTGGTGGAETVTLTEAQMPQHNHGVAGTYTSNDNEGDHSHSISDPQHSHGHISKGPGNQASGMNEWNGVGNMLSSNIPTLKESTGITINNNPYPYPSNSYGTRHKHTVTIGESSKGSNNAHENMPPFYVLAFIMRVS